VFRADRTKCSEFSRPGSPGQLGATPAVGYLSGHLQGLVTRGRLTGGSRTALALASPCRDEDAAAVQPSLVEIGHRVRAQAAHFGELTSFAHTARR